MSETTIQADAWLSGVCGHPVFRVASGADEALRLHIEQQTRAFYFAKVPASAVASATMLVGLGFRVVDVNVRFAADPRVIPRERGAAPGIIVTEARPGDREPVLQIAESCFRYSRFHVDPDFPRALANRIKRAWVANYFDRGRGDRIFVASSEGAVAGFLAALVTESAAVIDLIGVGDGFQRRGVGSALVTAFAEAYRARHRHFEVGTQLANTPSIALYGRLGFALVDGQYVLHRHKGA